MSTPSLREQKDEFTGHDQNFIAASNAVDHHALTCSFCKTPDTHNRGICRENILLLKAAHDAYRAAARAFEAAHPSEKI